MRRQSSLSNGFTFIELIVVITVTAILGTMGFASLASYNQSQQVVTTALDIKTMFQQARSQALSQIKPASCPTDLSNPNNNSVLEGYEVDFCAGSVLGRPAACKANNDYEVNALCGNGVNYVLIASKQYSSKLTITSTYRSYFFPVISAGVSNPGTVTVSGYGKSQQVTISNLGVIGLQ